MRTILVTGATGYIGRNLVRCLLKNGDFVYVLVRRKGSIWADTENVKEICCLMENYSILPHLLNGIKIDVFYHLAWEGTSGVQRSDYNLQLKNVNCTCAAAVVAKKINCKRFIVTGTISENVAATISQNHYSSQNLIYALSKFYTHNLLDVICQNIGLDYIWAQLSNIFGGDNTSGNLLSYALNEFNNNKVPEFGPCNQPYNFTYINDAVYALDLIGKSEKVSTQYVISNGECRLLKDYLLDFANVYEKSVGIGIRKDDGVVYKREWFDNQELRRLSYIPKYTFLDAVKSEKISYDRYNKI